MTSQKATNLRRGVRREDGVAVGLAEVAMKVKFGASRVDEQLSGAVVEEKRNVKRFLGDSLPLASLTLVALEPCGRAVQKAGHATDRGGQRVRASRHTANFDQSEGGATNFRSGSVKEKSLASEQRESAEKEIETTDNGDCREKHQLVGQRSE